MAATRISAQRLARLARPTWRASRPNFSRRQLSKNQKRTYSSGGESQGGFMDSDLPWAIGSAIVTIPGVYYLSQPMIKRYIYKETSVHGHDEHGEEHHEEEHAEGQSEDAEEAGDDKAAPADEEKSENDAKSGEQDKDEGESEDKSEEKGGDDEKPTEGKEEEADKEKSEESPEEKSGAAKQTPESLRIPKSEMHSKADDNLA